jgi:integrase
MKHGEINKEIGGKRKLKELFESRLRRLPDYRASSSVYQYTTAWKRFATWCGNEEVDVDPWDCSPFLVSLYLTEILENSESPSPVLNMAAAIVFMRKLVRGEELGLEADIGIMREVARRSFGEREVKRAKVISEEILLRLVARFGDASKVELQYYQDLAMILVGIEAYGRFSCIMERLKVERIDLSNADFITCKFDKRKNDQYGKFEPLAIEDTKNALACVPHVRNFIGITGSTKGPLFRGVDKVGKLTNTTMKYKQYLDRLRERLVEVGVSAEDSMLYATHSMRRTGNTTDLSYGVEKNVRQKKGAWKSMKSMKAYDDEVAACEMRQWRRKETSGSTSVSEKEDLDAFATARFRGQHGL